MGKWSNLTNIFQMDWNHHLEMSCNSFGPSKKNPYLTPVGSWIFAEYAEVLALDRWLGAPEWTCGGGENLPSFSMFLLVKQFT